MLTIYSWIVIQILVRGFWEGGGAKLGLSHWLWHWLLTVCIAIQLVCVTTDVKYRRSLLGVYPVVKYCEEHFPIPCSWCLCTRCHAASQSESSCQLCSDADRQYMAASIIALLCLWWQWWRSGTSREVADVVCKWMTMDCQGDESLVYRVLWQMCMSCVDL